MRIEHPRFQLGRVTDLGIEFVDGFAEVEELHPERRLALIQHGFTIDETADLAEHTVPELQEIAEERGVAVNSRAKKKDIVEAIVEKVDAATGALGYTADEVKAIVESDTEGV